MRSIAASARWATGGHAGASAAGVGEPFKRIQRAAPVERVAAEVGRLDAAGQLVGERPVHHGVRRVEEVGKVFGTEKVDKVH